MCVDLLPLIFRIPKTVLQLLYLQLCLQHSKERGHCGSWRMGRAHLPLKAIWLKLMCEEAAYVEHPPCRSNHNRHLLNVSKTQAVQPTFPILKTRHFTMSMSLPCSHYYYYYTDVEGTVLKRCSLHLTHTRHLTQSLVIALNQQNWFCCDNITCCVCVCVCLCVLVLMWLRSYIGHFDYITWKQVEFFKREDGLRQSRKWIVLGLSVHADPYADREAEGLQWAHSAVRSWVQNTGVVPCSRTLPV